MSLKLCGFLFFLFSWLQLHGLTSQPIGNSPNLVKKINGTEQFENALTEFMSSNGSSTDHKSIEQHEVGDRNPKNRTKRCSSDYLSFPISFHIPFYKYCGPGTKLDERLAKNVPAKNDLDEACKQHDIAYSQKCLNNKERANADRKLRDQAWQIATSKYTPWHEKILAGKISVTMGAMLGIRRVGDVFGQIFG